MKNIIVQYKVCGSGKETFNNIYDFERTSFDISFKWKGRRIYIPYENIFSLMLEEDENDT